MATPRSAERPTAETGFAEPQPAADPAAARLVSLDAYRGFIMLAMASSGLAIPRVVHEMKLTEGFWYHVAGQLEHVPWTGCAAWDLIQPAFMFMVGMAIPYSYARRAARGDSLWSMLGHAAGRALILVALGVFLASTSAKATNFLFTNVLAQIGLGYVFVVLLQGRGVWVQGLSALAILAGYWWLFYRHAVPEIGPSFDRAAWGIPPDWNHLLGGIQAHWNVNVNFAAWFDQRFLNLFPREKAWDFSARAAGYQTLNFVPAIATMIFGLMAGELLRSPRSAKAKLATLVVAGAVLLAAGLALGFTVCPIVKRIWTPAWALFSGGWVLGMLAAFYAVVDVAGYRRWTFPLVVVGMNSIVMYLMAQLMKPWTWSMLKIHIGPLVESAPSQAVLRAAFGLQGFPKELLPIVQAVSVLLVLWLVCVWLHRRKLFVRI